MSTYVAVTEDARVRIIDSKIRDRASKAHGCALTLQAWAQGANVGNPVVINDERTMLLEEIDQLLDQRLDFARGAA